MLLDLQDASAWSATTAHHYRYALKSLRKWCLTTRRNPGALTDEDLAQWVRKVSSSPSWTRITLAAVGAAYATRGLRSPAGERTAIAARLQARNAGPGRVRHEVSVPQLRKMVMTAPPGVACAAVVCWHGAFRIGELETLKVLHMTETLAVLSVVGKSGRRQQRLIPAKAIDLCPLWWLHNHAPSTWSGMHYQLKKWSKAAGLSTQTHAYRRGWATEAARQGVSAVAISLYLGHTDTRAALEYVGAAALDGIPALC